MITLKNASKAWLAVTDPDEPAQARIAARLRARRAGGTARRPVLLWASVLPAAAAFALSVCSDDADLDRTLEATGAEPLGDEVRVAWDGEGRASGTTRAPRLTWDQGHIEVDVTPEQGIDLRVVTDEAEVRVVGTRFDVDRDVLGTRVAVTHGVVQVRCASGADIALHAGESTLCKPIHAAPLFRRARALEEVDPAAALADVDAALADPTRPLLLDDELTALRIGLLDRLGRGDEVVQAATAYVGARRDEVARIGLTWATGPARCGLLDALRAPTGDESSARASCVEPSGSVGALPR